ncbi:PAS domain S-box protein [Vreelandella lionensis]|uniref:PAS domain S-box protein n=1 Tax=Vreelandella lionensis TaxID=1144478 RepID=UPI001374794D|nr:PAS domain S-box protein [Halomonas lionensis]
MPVNNRLNMWLPGGLKNPAIRFAQGRYTLRMPAQGVDGVAQILLETPALPTIRAMEAYRAVLLFMLAGVIGLGVLAAELLSRMITQPLMQLGKNGQALSHTIGSGETLQLPRSRIVEFQQLSNLLEEMATELSSAFKRLRHTHSNLEREVEQRTKALASSNDLLSSVLDAASDFAIIVTDTQGVIKLFNQGAENMLGYAADEVVGLHTPMLFHDTDEVGPTAYGNQQKCRVYLNPL